MFNRRQFHHRSPVDRQDHQFARLGHLDQLIEPLFGFDHGDEHASLLRLGMANDRTGAHQRHAPYSTFAKSTPLASGPNQVTKLSVIATTAIVRARARA